MQVAKRTSNNYNDNNRQHTAVAVSQYALPRRRHRCAACGASPASRPPPRSPCNPPPGASSRWRSWCGTRLRSSLRGWAVFLPVRQVCIGFSDKDIDRTQHQNKLETRREEQIKMKMILRRLFSRRHRSPLNRQKSLTLGSRETATCRSSATRWSRNLDITRSSAPLMPTAGPTCRVLVGCCVRCWLLLFFAVCLSRRTRSVCVPTAIEKTTSPKERKMTERERERIDYTLRSTNIRQK